MLYSKRRKNLGGGRRKSNRTNRFLNSKRRMMKTGGSMYQLKPVKERGVTYLDPIFNETITYGTKCDGDKDEDEEYRKKREAFANALKQDDHPCNIGSQKYIENCKKKPKPTCDSIETYDGKLDCINELNKSNAVCERKPTDAELAKCNEQRNEVMDEPCGEFPSRTTCMAGNAGQAKGAIRRYRGEPVRIKNQRLKETEETQNQDSNGITKVSQYCSKIKKEKLKNIIEAGKNFEYIISLGYTYTPKDLREAFPTFTAEDFSKSGLNESVIRDMRFAPKDLKEAFPSFTAEDFSKLGLNESVIRNMGFASDELKEDVLYTLDKIPTTTKFSLEALQARAADTAGCDKTRLHEYLTDADFQKTFGMSAANFAKMPGWKQADAKKKHRLF